MAKNAKELSQVKARQTKLGKKSSDELIQIILKKDKVERNLNNQIKSLKGEVNNLLTKVSNFNKDMEGTVQSLESYKDKCNTLQEKNDSLALDYKTSRALFQQENKRAITLTDKLGVWKVATCIMTIIAIIAIFIAII